MKTKLTKEIDLIVELKKIKHIPGSSTNTCHEDHEEMSESIEDLIELIKEQNSKRGGENA